MSNHAQFLERHPIIHQCILGRELSAVSSVWYWPYVITGLLDAAESKTTKQEGQYSNIHPDNPLHIYFSFSWWTIPSQHIRSILQTHYSHTLLVLLLLPFLLLILLFFSSPHSSHCHYTLDKCPRTTQTDLVCRCPCHRLLRVSDWPLLFCFHSTFGQTTSSPF